MRILTTAPRRFTTQDDAMTLIGIFALALVILGGIASTLFAKRNDEMQSGEHH